MAGMSQRKSQSQSPVNLNHLLCAWIPQYYWDIIQPNWNELPEDVICLILQKLGTFEIIYTAQFVCSLWRKLSKQPHLFCCIHFHGELDNFNGDKKMMQSIVSQAVDRSCGQLIEFSVEYNSIVDEYLLLRVVETSKQLKCLRLASSLFSLGFVERLKGALFLEELELSCRANFLGDPWHMERMAVYIVEHMPSLCRLRLHACYITATCLETILNGCPSLNHLDLSECNAEDIDQELQLKCAEKFITFKLPVSIYYRSYYTRCSSFGSLCYSSDTSSVDDYPSDDGEFDDLSEYVLYWQDYDNGYGDYSFK